MLKHEEIESAFGRTIDSYKSIDENDIVEYQTHPDGIFIIVESEDVINEDIVFLTWTNIEDLIELFHKLKVKE